MTPGSKLVLIMLGVGGLVGVAVLAGAKKANAAPLPAADDDDEGTIVLPPTDNAPPVVVPSEPEGGISRTDPFAVPGIQDGQEANQLLLRWWAAEGQSLVDGDTSDDRPQVPANFGSQPADLSGNFGSRSKQVAAAFQHYSGLTPEDGVLTNPLLLALRRWASSQRLPREALPAAQTPSAPVLPPIVLPRPAAPPLTSPAVIPVPPPLPPLPVAQAPILVPAPPAERPPVSELPPVAPPMVPLPPIVAPPTVVPVPVAPAPAVPPVVAAAEQPSTVSEETAELVNELLMAERTKGWNRVEPTVKAWQKSRGLVVDGKFGPKSALMVAEEFGTIPIIRFWPKGSQKAPALLDYRTKLIELSNQASGPRKAQLKVSSQREQAQSFGAAAGAAPALPEQLQVQIAKVA
jgi:peptidoglycan hydrolase-like protein with peptidoglycan-binding domain